MIGLRRSFKRADGSADAILADPYTRLRIGLKSLLPAEENSPAFTRDLFEDFVHALTRSSPDPKYIDRELPVVVAAIARGEAPLDPNISRPETQLLWAAALIYIMRNPDAVKAGWPAAQASAPLTQTDLWQSLVTAPNATEEMINHHFYLSEAMRNSSVKMRWGPPGSWFYYAPEENIINVDFLTTLLGGFEHTRSVLFHEIGHSQLTVKFLPSMNRIQQDIQALKDKTKAAGGKRSRDDHLAIRMLKIEWNLRMQLIDKTENAVVNRYAANMGKILAQDYGYSMNHTLTTISGYGQAILNHDAKSKDGALAAPPAAETAADLAGKRLTTIMNAINLVFFKNNAYFPNTKAGWRRLGVDPDLIRRDNVTPQANDNAVPEEEFSADFKLFLELCGGPQGLEHLQPTPKDRIFGREYYNALTDDYADQRNAIAERIWDEFIDPFMKDLRQELEEKIQQDMEKQAQQKQDQKNEKQDGDDQQGEGQEGEGQEGESQDGESQDQGAQGQKGEKGQKGKKGKPQKGESADQPGDDAGDPGDEDNQDAASDDADAKGDKGKKSDQKGRSKTADKLAQDGLSEEEKVDVDGAGEMQDVDTPPEKPGQQDMDVDAKKGKDAKKDQEKNQGKDKDGGEAKSIEEIMEDLERRKKEIEKKAKEQAGKKGEKGDADAEGNADSDDAEGGGDTPSQQAGGGGKEIDIDELALRNWSDYAGLVEEISPMINQVARMMEKIRERQIQKMKTRSRHLEQLPQDNEMHRLDRDAHRNLIIKQRTGQDLEDRDFNRFRKDKVVDLPITPDFVFMIDGSYSMNSKISKNATHMHVALLSAIIMYEAAKRIEANVYISLWGNASPIMLAQPGQEDKKTGENLARAISGLNSGTDLAPSFLKMVAAIVDNKEKTKPFAGYTHFMVLSDGDINDKTKAEQVIDNLFQASKYITLDFGIIKRKNSDSGSLYSHMGYGGDGKTDMEKVSDNVQAKLPHQKVGAIVNSNPEVLTLGIIGLLIEKLMICNSFTAVPQAAKKSAFRRALLSMDVK